MLGNKFHEQCYWLEIIEWWYIMNIWWWTISIGKLNCFLIDTRLRIVEVFGVTEYYKLLTLMDRLFTYIGTGLGAAPVTPSFSSDAFIICELLSSTSYMYDSYLFLTCIYVFSLCFMYFNFSMSTGRNSFWN